MPRRRNPAPSYGGPARVPRYIPYRPARRPRGDAHRGHPRRVHQTCGQIRCRRRGGRAARRPRERRGGRGAQPVRPGAAAGSAGGPGDRDRRGGRCLRHHHDLVDEHQLPRAQGPARRRRATRAQHRWPAGHGGNVVPRRAQRGLRDGGVPARCVQLLPRERGDRRRRRSGGRGACLRDRLPHLQGGHALQPARVL